MHACEPASADPAEAEELPSPLPPALRALALLQRSPTTGAAQAVTGAAPVRRAADVACPISTSSQQSQSASTQPPAQPVEETALEASGSELHTRTSAVGSSPALFQGADRSSQEQVTATVASAGHTNEVEHAWDKASSSATGPALDSRSHSAVSCERHRLWGTESLAADQRSVVVGASNAVTADCSQDGWPEQRGQQQMPYIPAARVSEASGGDINIKLQMRSLVPHHNMLPGMTVQQVRQVSPSPLHCFTGYRWNDCQGYLSGCCNDCSSMVCSCGVRVQHVKRRQLPGWQRRRPSRLALSTCAQPIRQLLGAELHQLQAIQAPRSLAVLTLKSVLGRMQRPLQTCPSRCCHSWLPEGLTLL